MTFLTYATANIRGAFDGMKQELVRDDLVAIRRELDPDVLALQEFWRPRYNRAARNVYRPHGYRLHTPWFKSPSLAWWGGAFAVDDPEILTPLHSAVWEGQRLRSDPRQILGQRVTTRAGLLPLTILSTHRAPGTWHVEHVEKLIQLIADEVQAGRPVQLGADLNTHASKPLGDTIAGQPVRYVQHGVDFLAFIDSADYGWLLNRSSKKVIELHSDHDALSVSAALRRRPGNH